MAVSSKWLRTVLLAFIVLAALIACKPETPPARAPQTGAGISPIQTPPPGVTNEPVPALPFPTVVLSSCASGADIPLQTGKDIVCPTWTPWPTFTPRPTPTRRPGSTAIAMPLPKPANDPAGVIWYTTRMGSSPNFNYFVHTLHIDPQGRAAYAPESLTLPVDLGFSPGVVYPSPNGRYMVLMRPVEPGGRPYVYDQATSKVSVLFESYSGGSFFGWHPDNRHFLFWIDDVGLLLIDAATLEVTTLVYPEGPVQGAAFSPDGVKIAYIDSHRPESIGSLWFVSSAGSDARPTVNVGTAYLYPDAWSPDGKRIVYYGDCGQQKSQSTISGPLCALDVQSDERHALDLPYVGFDPVWSPDGRYIAATGLTPGEKSCDAQKGLSSDDREACWYRTSSVFIVDTQTYKTYPLTRGIAPSWSPDGLMIAFLSDHSGATEIWTIRADGSELQQLTTDGQYKSPFSHYTWLQEISK
jgi:Tol biopolymer transport system component